MLHTPPGPPPRTLHVESGVAVYVSLAKGLALVDRSLHACRTGVCGTSQSGSRRRSFPSADVASVQGSGVPVTTASDRDVGWTRTRFGPRLPVSVPGRRPSLGVWVCSLSGRGWNPGGRVSVGHGTGVPGCRRDRGERERWGGRGRNGKKGRGEERGKEGEEERENGVGVCRVVQVSRTVRGPDPSQTGDPVCPWVRSVGPKRPEDRWSD